VVDLANEFAVTSTQMLAICDRLGVEATDASSWIDASTVRRMRSVIGLAGPDAVVGRPVTRRAPRVSRRRAQPELGSVLEDGVRTRRAVAIAVLIIVVAAVAGLLINHWVLASESAAAAPSVAALTLTPSARPR
jgi:hypothetical protein